MSGEAAASPKQPESGGTNPFDDPFVGAGNPAESSSGSSVIFIGQEVINVYNLLVESGRWDTDYTTKPSEFRNTLLTLRRILTGGGLDSIQNPKKENILIKADLYKPLADLITTTSPATSRKTLKRLRKTTRKQSFKHSRRQK